MAEIQSASLKSKNKKLSTRVDLTPMVDLGFLLITFFIFTTTLNEQKVMRLSLPKAGPDMKLPASKTLSVLLYKNSTISYYMGDNPAKMQTTNYSATGVRTVINSVQKTVAKKFGTADELIVLIKPTDDANYENIVKMLDEMLINNVKRYVLADVAENETAFLHF